MLRTLQLDLQQVAVAAGPHEHGLAPKLEAVGVRGEDRVGDGAGLVVGVGAPDELRTSATLWPRGDERDRQPPRPDHVGEVEHLLGGAVAAVERDDRGPGEVVGEGHQVLGGCAAEGVDRLGVVADDGEALAVGAQQPHDVDLDLVDVLVLVDEHPVPPRTESGTRVGVGEQRAAVEQEVVEVEQPPGTLASAVGAQQLVDRVHVVEAPGELVGDHLARRDAGVDGPRVDVGEGLRGRQPGGGCVEPVLRAHEVEQVDDVARVDDGDLTEPEVLGVLAHQTVRHRVERPAPDALRGRGIGAERCGS